MPVTGLWRPKVASVLGRASIAYLAVETSSGPHVTPLLFAATPDRLWFGIGRGTLKARALGKRPAVGVVVPGGEGSVAIRGEATLLDRLPASPAELVRTPFALPAFAARNALEMAAFARDVARRGAQPQQLAPLSVRVETLDFLDGWPAHAVLGWMAPGGPIALPAQWDARTERARVPASPLKEAGGSRTAAACVCIDESEGPGPLAKRGRLLRGQGHATLRGDVASVALEPERITRWKGFQTQTAAAAGR
jgi:pyridoxamine 5'-phosphate oxidase-like protein